MRNVQTYFFEFTSANNVCCSVIFGAIVKVFHAKGDIPTLGVMRQEKGAQLGGCFADFHGIVVIRFEIEG